MMDRLLYLYIYQCSILQIILKRVDTMCIIMHTLNMKNWNVRDFIILIWSQSKLQFCLWNSLVLINYISYGFLLNGVLALGTTHWYHVKIRIQQNLVFILIIPMTSVWYYQNSWSNLIVPQRIIGDSLAIWYRSLKRARYCSIGVSSSYSIPFKHTHKQIHNILSVNSIKRSFEEHYVSCMTFYLLLLL